MQITFGIDHKIFKAERKNVPIVWDSNKVINGHVLLVGKSGTGKTYNLRKILKQLLSQSAPGKIRVHIFDVHGDIEIPGASSVKFSASTPYGFNPLWINPDPDFGGLRNRINSFIYAINSNSRQLGTKQEATLRNLLMDLYQANGFKDQQPHTWVLDDGVQRKYPKKNPTLEDAYKFAVFKQKAMFIGGNTVAVQKLEELNRKQASYYSKQRQALRKGQGEYKDPTIESDIKKLQEECSVKYTEYLQSIATGMEFDDVLRYDSPQVLKSVVERLENLNAVGIFKNQKPPFDESAAMWRYDIKPLSMAEKKLFVSFRLEEIFYNAMQRETHDQSDIRDIIVLDEAHNFFNDDEENITNTIAKEARKFGISMICASQSVDHFSDDFLMNVGTKIILGLAKTAWDSAYRKLKFENGMMELVVPQKTMAIEIDNKGQLDTEMRLALITPD